MAIIGRAAGQCVGPVARCVWHHPAKAKNPQPRHSGIAQSLRQGQQGGFIARRGQCHRRRCGAQIISDIGRRAAQTAPSALKIARHPIDRTIAQHHVKISAALIVQLHLKRVGKRCVSTIKSNVLPSDGDHICNGINIHPDRSTFRAFAVQPRINIGQKRRNEGRGQVVWIFRQARDGTAK